MRDVKKLLSEGKADILPDDKIKDNIKRQLGYDREEPSLAYAHGGEAVAPARRKTLFVALALALVLVAVLCIVLPVALKKRGGGLTITNKFSQITDAQSFYAYGAASVGALLDASDSAANASPARAAAAPKASSAIFAASGKSLSETEDLSAAQTVNRYMSLIESLLGEGNISGEEGAGERGYGYSMTVRYTDLLGETVSYVMYYDKTFLHGQTEGDETEKNYSVEGVMLVGEREYPVRGTYETESEEGESESEFSFRAFTSGENSFIEVSREWESEGAEREETYVYSVYEEGLLCEKTSIEYEAEDGELELKMTVEKDGKTKTLYFREETEKGERVLSVHGNLDGQTVRFRVYIRQGQYHYVFEDGSSSDRDRFDDDDEEEDDDGD